MANRTPPGAQAALLGLGSLLCAGAIASTTQNMPAVPQNEQEIVARFKAADKNGDGKVTLEEAKEGLPRVALAWDKIDVDKKGYITLEQLLIISSVNN